jgi:methylenetetrahydrofolate dehydrogenase (NADP+) / methenyltetrahydrofolate cyclohydrolase
MNKAEIREYTLKIREQLTQEEITKSSKKICRNIRLLPQLSFMKNIALYAAVGNEVNIDPFIEGNLLPRVQGQSMEYFKVNSTKELSIGTFNVREPNESCLPNSRDIGLIFVPGVAFDNNGNRIGHGKGYYDRFLKNTNATKVGICFESQLVNSIPTENHDIQMDYVITEKQILSFNKGKILDGTKICNTILHKAKEKVTEPITMALLLVGEDPASIVYTKIKKKRADKIGVSTDIIKLPTTSTQEEVIAKIKELNSSYSGLIVQLPLPKHLNPTIINAIDPTKDIDGLTWTSLGKVIAGDETFAPATPKAVIRILEEYNVPFGGKEVVIINRSNLIGKPMAMMFLNRSSTVTVCHSRTKNLVNHTKNADIIVVGVGKQNFITSDMVKDGVVIIDVGISKVDGKIVGDVDPSVIEKASFMTPVPGGVGPATVAILIENLVNYQTKNS